MKRLYFCSGCRKIHYDDDYSRIDGDLEIFDWEGFFESARNMNTILKHGEKP